MPLMSTCVGRLGSRFSMILDPIRREISYGSLGLLCQEKGEWVAGVEAEGKYTTFPLTKQGEDFFNVDQNQTMTGLLFEGRSPDLGIGVDMEIIAPFWPQDVETSIFPGYIVEFRVKTIDRCRWEHPDKDQKHTGKIRFTLDIDGIKAATSKGKVKMSYKPKVVETHTTGEGGEKLEFNPKERKTKLTGQATDYIVPLGDGWKVTKGTLEANYDADKGEQVFHCAIVSYMGDALFERFHESMPLKYTTIWKNADDLVKYVQKNYKKLLDASRKFDSLWTDSSIPKSAQDLTALSFQSYLGCTIWCQTDRTEHFSVWEGSCWYNSTVDVTFQESMFYFAFWPELMDLIIEEWSHHANDFEGEKVRRSIVSDDDVNGNPLVDFPGRIMEHDMGAGWTCNGQSYHHAMPVEENSNFLTLLYAHGEWWGKPELYKKYNQLNRDLVDYLMWTDSTGNGFPDRGTANTIDDATPAVQYGRDNVYLGVKRIGALHSAMRMFEVTGDREYASMCRKEVRKAVKTLNEGWLEDHWGVCLDKSAEGLYDCWTREPLPYKILPGWDAYSLYTTNGLVPLMLIDDLPVGISKTKLREDVVNACRQSMGRYGCGHSSLDMENMWVSMNVWRDLAAAYLGHDMLANNERYWGQQMFANGPGSEKANCFTETSLTNNLVWYPRNTAMFGLPMAIAQLNIDRKDGVASVSPIVSGRWPLLALADWKKGKIPFATAEQTRTGRVKGGEIENEDAVKKLKVKVK
ncbi:MAG: glutaminase domain-containing protein [Phycisphaerae bacterium]